MADQQTVKSSSVKAKEEEKPVQDEKPTWKPKEEPGSYDHTQQHFDHYSIEGVLATDSPIDRAWARLFDADYNAGPALFKPYMFSEHEERQYFLYAEARRDTSETNVNKTVVFYFGVTPVSESGL